MNQVYNLKVETSRNINSIKPVPLACASIFIFKKAALTLEKYLRLILLEALSIPIKLTILH